ncbi:Lipase, putative [Penicillium digitatum PHI26]|uniref:Lipase, putative n=2 Tax=Penicillium digitatum TaxID=36651 RepID=K9FSX6_PEND2|nr:Lipase, putative [Penicillium digitatum Pd1]EKV11602.1 Lipase, putative [Penicillium digitatum PHI26]EKV14851.1 Lipase, putative [Penicillium digitatum Pd1]
MVWSMTCRVLAMLSVSSIAIASPAQLARRDVPAISSELLERFTLFSQFASLSACDQNINHTGQSLTCDYGTCELVEADNTTVINTFHSNHGPTGYIALDHTQQLIVLTFRGTVSESDGNTDLDIVLTPIDDVCTGCKAHLGFWVYWSDVASQASIQLRNATTAYPGYKLNVVGHSLGGGIAALAGTVLRTQGFILDIWTFGGPKPGNMKLAEFITNQQLPNSIYRATHATDPIPKVPLNLPFLDWSQPSPEYWITQKTGVQVTPDGVEYIEGINSKAGNAGSDRDLRWPNPNHAACTGFKGN